MRFRNRLLILVVAIFVPAFFGATLAVADVYFEQQKDQEGILRTLAPVPAGTPGTLGHAGGRVLFVEHGPLVREAVAGGLRQAGFTVRAAEDGDTAPSLLEAGLVVDVVLAKPCDIAQAVRLLGGFVAQE